MFTNLLEYQFPRVLTQVNRDENSESYGSFDRNWWHYKIRDFSSIIIQQGGYFILQYSKFSKYEDISELKKIAIASVKFWAKRALKYGAFEEYYPWERGYPPLAFSTLAVAKIIDELNIKDDILIDKALKLSSQRLQNRFESQAANQQVAGLAALAVIKKIKPEFVDNEKFKLLSKNTLDLQTKEGWFIEYGGPDLGYLSVTMDCLWDLYDYTGDKKYYNACVSALKFIYPFVNIVSASIGMHNARNTDYIVPYGIARFLNDNNDVTREKAKSIFYTLYNNIGSSHFFLAVDDRYWVHYIGHSVARAQLFLIKEKINLKSNYANKTDAFSEFFRNSGHYLYYKNNTSLIVSCNKGGIITYFSGDKFFSDFGWIIKRGEQQFVSHWWNDSWEREILNDKIIIKGFLVPSKEISIVPIKHVALRVASFLVGSGLIKFLKKKMIFKDKLSDINFEREIFLKENQLIIKDKIKKVKNTDIIIRAPRASKRHVSSADSFHIEDVIRSVGFKVKIETKNEDGYFMSKLIIS